MHWSMAEVAPTARPVMKRVQRARGNALTLKKAWRLVQEVVRFLEKGRTRPTVGREERQVGQIPSLGWAMMQPQAPQRGSSLGSVEGLDRAAPRAAMIRRTKARKPARAMRINGRVIGMGIVIAGVFVGNIGVLLLYLSGLAVGYPGGRAPQARRVNGAMSRFNSLPASGRYRGRS